MSKVQMFAVTNAGIEDITPRESAGSIHEAFDHLPVGVYTSFRSFQHNRILFLDEHLARLAKSGELLGMDFALDNMSIRQAIHRVISSYPSQDCRVRVDILSAPVRVINAESRLCIALSPLESTPKQFIDEGVGVQVAAKLHREMPIVKSADFVLKRRPYPLYKQEAYDHLLLDSKGNVLEGSSSNFFAICKEEVITCEIGMLEGITRKIVLKLASELNIPVRLRNVPLKHHSYWDGAFLTSSARGVIPVVKISESMVGRGLPHPIAQSLLAAYDEFALRRAQPAV